MVVWEAAVLRELVVVVLLRRGCTGDGCYWEEVAVVVERFNFQPYQT